MNNERRSVVWGLVALGAALLLAWFFSVVAYGYEVDAAGQIAQLRVQDLVLAGGSAACLLSAILLAVMSRRRGRRVDR